MANLSKQNIALRFSRATSIIPLVLFLATLAMLPRTIDYGSYRFEFSWIAGLGVQMSFMFDGLSVLFALIITGIGFFVTLYAADYIQGNQHTGRFFVFLHAFMLSMLGLIAADNVLALFVFWELTTIFSYLLIGFEHEKETSRKSARQALLVTGAGGLALLIGFLLLEIISGTYEISQMTALSLQIKQHPLYAAALTTVLIGAFTKSAQYPFHFWLPNAMAAPTPISAFLHSATMVKAGVYLLARFHPVLGGTHAWTTTLVFVGAVTAVSSAIMALGQSDLKKILAYTTVTALGIITLFLGGNSQSSITAAITFLLVHSLYKSALFMIAGIIDHQTHTRQVDELGGLWDSMPYTAFAAVAACLSMAGFPLFFGFIGKEIMYKGALAETMFPILATTAAVLSNALMVSIAMILFIKPFLGQPGNYYKFVREASPYMWCGPVILGGLDILFGILPDLVGQWLIQPAVNVIDCSAENIELSLFHGINEPLLLSIITLVLGIRIYLKQQFLYKWINLVFTKIPLTASRTYDLIINGIAVLGKMQTRLIQNGSLHRYFFVVVSVFVFGAGYSYLSHFESFPSFGFPLLDIREWLLAILILAAIAGVVFTRSRLLAVCGLGVIGVGIAMIFLSFGAPDVALTQLLVETLTVIIVSIILLRVPRLSYKPVSQKPRKVLDAFLAIFVGILMTTLSLALVSHDLDRSITTYFEQNSYLAAHGRNIVNVILVDFRSMDTLGEIIVVATAGLAGYALILKRRRK
ncbi:MAG: hydrogen gas-evolving membrane-bound hydrogenase subunit E [Desulfobacterales bacterium]